MKNVFNISTGSDSNWFPSKLRVLLCQTPAFHTEDCVGSLDTSLRSVKVGSGREMPIKFRVVAIVGSAPNVVCGL